MKSMSLTLVVSSLTAVALLANCTITTNSDSADGGAGTGQVSAGTGGTSSLQSCVPGETLGCFCTATTQGVQTCASNGTFGACTGCETVGSGGTTGSGPCTSGTTQNCLCGPNSAGVQICNGTGWGPCALCSDGSGGAGYAGSAGYGGTSGAAGTGTGGAPMVYGDCGTCIAARCQQEFDACSADKGDPDSGIDVPCWGDGVNGQFGQFTSCMESLRTLGALKPDDAVACGDSVESCTPQTCFWPPSGMTAPTTNLINCLATDKTNTNCTSNCPNDSGLNNSWATPNNGFTWPPTSCAKTDCTSYMP
ncbi:MAG TPA: hypothetical protein VGI10_07815 [Polyangiaceae bacterium]|jgi:hypothetical protein